jgi:uncharacterized protein (DUF1330 family)
MTTYLINHLRIPGEVPNAEGLEYLEKVEATFKPFGGKWLVLGEHDEVVEGAWPGGVVLMEFPDRDAAQEWYRSPAYQEIVHLRTDNTISDIILVDRVGPDFTSADFAQGVRAAVFASGHRDG